MFFIYNISLQIESQLLNLPYKKYVFFFWYRDVDELISEWNDVLPFLGTANEDLLQHITFTLYLFHPIPIFIILLPLFYNRRKLENEITFISRRQNKTTSY